MSDLRTHNYNAGIERASKT